jgi:hypothetical protein
MMLCVMILVTRSPKKAKSTTSLGKSSLVPQVLLLLFRTHHPSLITSSLKDGSLDKRNSHL